MNCQSLVFCKILVQIQGQIPREFAEYTGIGIDEILSPINDATAP